MKTIKYLFLLVLFALVWKANAQDTAIWKHDINSKPDSVSVFPVKVMHDRLGFVYTLSTWFESKDSIVSKIYLKKIDTDGNLIWSRIYANTGKGHPRAFDMTISDSSVYIVGGFKSVSYEKPLLMKIDFSGTVLQTLDSLGTFKLGSVSQILNLNRKLYLGGSGLAILGYDCHTIWSLDKSVSKITLDYSGRMLVIGNDTGGVYVHRYSSVGAQDLSIYVDEAGRIACEKYHGFYLLSDHDFYTLVKYDSNGQKQWSKDKLAEAPAFGDIGYEVLVDPDNNVCLIGLSDSMYKFSSDGQLIYKKSMDGLDAYIISAGFNNSGVLYVGGSLYNGTEYLVAVASYNYYGKQNWRGEYNALGASQEFTVSIDISDYTAVYLLENMNQNSRLLKFNAPEQKPANLSEVCISKIEYDQNDNFIRVTLYNGSTGFISYPNVQIVDSNGDTISNKQKQLNFFGQLNNTFQVYRDSISKKGITDFRTYTVLLNLSFADTTITLKWCDQIGIKTESPLNKTFTIYPNPFESKIYIQNPLNIPNAVFILTDAIGKEICRGKIEEELLLENIARGIYFYSIRIDSLLVQSGKLLSY